LIRRIGLSNPTNNGPLFDVPPTLISFLLRAQRSQTERSLTEGCDQMRGQRMLGLRQCRKAPPDKQI
jgi:hypothetical protein